MKVFCLVKSSMMVSLIALSLESSDLLAGKRPQDTRPAAESVGITSPTKRARTEKKASSYYNEALMEKFLSEQGIIREYVPANLKDTFDTRKLYVNSFITYFESACTAHKDLPHYKTAILNWLLSSCTPKADAQKFGESSFSVKEKTLSEHLKTRKYDSSLLTELNREYHQIRTLELKPLLAKYSLLMSDKAMPETAHPRVKLAFDRLVEEGSMSIQTMKRLLGAVEASPSANSVVTAEGRKYFYTLVFDIFGHTPENDREGLKETIAHKMTPSELADFLSKHMESHPDYDSSFKNAFKTALIKHEKPAIAAVKPTAPAKATTAAASASALPSKAAPSKWKVPTDGYMPPR